jgi:hypothetical protein
MARAGRFHILLSSTGDQRKNHCTDSAADILGFGQADFIAMLQQKYL